MIHTFSPSTRFVTITMAGGRSCHISLQKSFKVLSVGPYNDCFRTINSYVHTQHKDGTHPVWQCNVSGLRIPTT